LANAIENYTAFAFARAFLISRWFIVCGLLFIVWRLLFGVWDTFNSFCLCVKKTFRLCSLESFARNKKAQEFGNFRMPMLVISPIIKVIEIHSSAEIYLFKYNDFGINYKKCKIHNDIFLEKRVS
jgi:hypothetical protein